MRVTITIETFAGETQFEKSWPSEQRLTDLDDAAGAVQALIKATTAQALLAYPIEVR